MKPSFRATLIASLALMFAGCTTQVETPIIDLSATPGEETAGELNDDVEIGTEVGLPARLSDGDEFRLSTKALIAFGQKSFDAVWTPQEGGGRPLTKGNGQPLADMSDPLIFPRNFNRLSAMDSNSCASCHNTPYSGGGGHFTANAFIPSQRFDFLNFSTSSSISTKAFLDERGRAVTLITDGLKTDSATNSRATIGLFGSGYIEMLARQMTSELRRQRDSLTPGASVRLTSKGVDYGTLSRREDGTWDVSKVEGIAASSLVAEGSSGAPSLVLRPFHQSSVVVSIREFTNNAMNHHHGIQTTERFGPNSDPDGDGHDNELSRAEVTATSVFQATLPVPGRVIPRNRKIEHAVWKGERQFEAIGCATCHRSSLPLTDNAWVYSEPNPFNPPGNLLPNEVEKILEVDLNNESLPGARLAVQNGVVNVPAYTDLKTHDITSGPNDPNCEPINMQHPSMLDGRANPAFFDGNCRFLTKKLWGVANEPPYFHHGKYTTLREAILAHAGEAEQQRAAFSQLSGDDQASIIEFLKTLQVLPASVRASIVDENGNSRQWPPKYLADLK